MTTFNLSLSDEAAQFVRDQAAKRGFSSGNEFLESLITDAMHQPTESQIEDALLAGLASGPAVVMDDSDWASIESEVEKRVAGK